MEKISVRLEEKDKMALEEYARANDLNISQVIRKMIRDFLVKEKC